MQREHAPEQFRRLCDYVRVSGAPLISTQLWAKGEPMTDVRAADVSIIAAEGDLIDPIGAAEPWAINWAAVAAGTFANAALTLLLLAFGAGMGFSAISPWSGSGVSMTTFSVGTGLYLIVMAMLASTVGGYLAGR